MNKELLEMKKTNEELVKRLLFLEVLIGFMSSVIIVVLIFIASYLEMDNIVRIILIGIGSILFTIGIVACLSIEHKVGFYECGKCHHKYIPTLNSILWAVHFCRTRYLKCPECGKMSWSRKVISK